MPQHREGQTPSCLLESAIAVLPQGHPPPLGSPPRGARIPRWPSSGLSLSSWDQPLARTLDLGRRSLPACSSPTLPGPPSSPGLRWSQERADPFPWEASMVNSKPLEELGLQHSGLGSMAFFQATSTGL